MRAINGFAMVVGYGVVFLALLGAFGLGDFVLRFGPTQKADGKKYTCHDGDGFLTRRKYACDFKEYAEREAAGLNKP